MSAGEPDVRSVSKALFALAKAASNLALLGEITAMGLGAWFAFARVPEWQNIPVLAALALLTFYLHGMADRWKEQADGMLRLLDVVDGLGTRIPPRSRADILAEISDGVIWLAGLRPAPNEYFASLTPGSPRRLVENMRESAWWTMRIGRSAEAMQKLWVWLFGLLGVCVLVVEALRPGGTQQGLSGFLTTPSFVIAVLLFLFTSGPYRRIGEYRAFHEAAKDIDARAERMLDAPERITEAAARQLAADYHLARKGSPLLPGFIWSMRQRKLNRLWGEVARESTQSA
jgi:hypothetical protein